MTSVNPRPRHKVIALDPAILALIDALAIAQAQEDHAAEERAAAQPRNRGGRP